jgi:hypothetical protein
MTEFRCCLSTPEPGPWKAGGDDTASPEMIESMNRIRRQMAAGYISYRTPILNLIEMLRASAQLDNRTMLGGDIQRCLLHNAADRLTLLAYAIDPRPWATLRNRLGDAWNVIRGRAVVTYVSASVFDPGWPPWQKPSEPEHFGE